MKKVLLVENTAQAVHAQNWQSQNQRKYQWTVDDTGWADEGLPEHCCRVKVMWVARGPEEGTLAVNWEIESTQGIGQTGG